MLRMIDPTVLLRRKNRTERTAVAHSRKPSPLRRFLVTIPYLALSLVLSAAIAVALKFGGANSLHCLHSGVCTAAEQLLDNVLAIGALLLTATVIALGWTGRLPGAHRHR